MTFPYKGLRSMASLWVKIDNPSEKEQIITKITQWINGFSEDHKFEIGFNNHDDSLHVYTIEIL